MADTKVLVQSSSSGKRMAPTYATAGELVPIITTLALYGAFRPSDKDDVRALEFLAYVFDTEEPDKLVSKLVEMCERPVGTFQPVCQTLVAKVAAQDGSIDYVDLINAAIANQLVLLQLKLCPTDWETAKERLQEMALKARTNWAAVARMAGLHVNEDSRRLIRKFELAR